MVRHFAIVKMKVFACSRTDLGEAALKWHLSLDPFTRRQTRQLEKTVRPPTLRDGIEACPTMLAKVRATFRGVRTAF
jgi:hypothetical protein